MPIKPDSLRPFPLGVPLLTSLLSRTPLLSTRDGSLDLKFVDPKFDQEALQHGSLFKDQLSQELNSTSGEQFVRKICRTRASKILGETDQVDCSPFSSVVIDNCENIEFRPWSDEDRAPVGDWCYVALFYMKDDSVDQTRKWFELQSRIRWKADVFNTHHRFLKLRRESSLDLLRVIRHSNSIVQGTRAQSEKRWAKSMQSDLARIWSEVLETEIMPIDPFMLIPKESLSQDFFVLFSWDRSFHYVTLSMIEEEFGGSVRNEVILRPFGGHLPEEGATDTLKDEDSDELWDALAHTAGLEKIN